METVATILLEKEDILSYFRRVFFSLGFLVQDNLLKMYKDEKRYPLKIQDRPEIIFAFHKYSESKDFLIRYIEDPNEAHKKPDYGRVFLFCESNDEELKSLCSELHISYSSFSESDLKSSVSQTSNSTVRKAFEAIFNWLKDISPSKNQGYRLTNDYIPDLTRCLAAHLDLEDAPDYNEVLPNPYYHYYFFKERYEILNSKKTKAEFTSAVQLLLHDIQEKVQEYNNFTCFYTLMGLISQYKLCDYKESFKYFKTAYELNPLDAYSAYYVGLASDELTPFYTSESLKYFKKTIENNSLCYQAHFRIAQIYYNVGHLDVALAEYKEIYNILSYSQETNCLNYDRTLYLWKYHYFSMKIYEQRNMYSEALFHIKPLLTMRKNGLYLSKDDEDIIYFNDTINFLEKKKSDFEERLAISRRKNSGFIAAYQSFL